MSRLARLKQNNYFLFEAFIFVRLMALYLPRAVKNMLIQDKICLWNHNQSAFFCQHIQLQWNDSEQALAKDEVLSDVAQFSNYVNLIESIGMVVWALFVGSFLDRSPAATFIMLSLNIVSDIFASTVFMLCTHFYYETDVHYLLIASLSSWFTGGMMTFTTTAYRYVSLRTEAKSRVGMFVILEVIVISGAAFAIFLGGQLLWIRDDTDDDGPQLRTYNYSFILTLLLNLVMIVLLALLILACRNNRKAKRIDKSVEKTSTELHSTQQPEQNTNSNSNQSKSSNLLAKLFDIQNVKQTLTCLLKPRANNVRLQIYLLCIVLFNKVLVTKGLEGMLLGFSQKVYNWTPTQYSTYSAVQQIAQTLLMGLCSILLMKVWKLQDRTLIFIAMVSVFCCDAIGLFLTSYVFFVSIPIGALAGLGGTAIKSQLSKIVPPDEIGKILSIGSIIEALVPFAASLIYSNLFTLTISVYPGVIYLFSCAVMLVTLAVMAIEWRYCPVKIKK